MAKPLSEMPGWGEAARARREAAGSAKQSFIHMGGLALSAGSFKLVAPWLLEAAGTRGESGRRSPHGNP